ncbi:MAG TPA: TetR family transcriptional regulator [Acidimicrobiaceae bacterium]|jgi:AcrR family transcriptional regulator|nr:TetR family transcriptional regulator [Acidimicrobiaceae bacterium]
MSARAELDPRVLRTRRHVLAAARAVLVEEGWERVTVTRVADRSGYARTTLYRHWPQRLDLLRDLITDEVHLLHTVPTGDVRADLVAELEAFRVAITTTGLGRVMIAIGQQASDDGELAELSSAVRADGTRVLDEIITSAVARGELRAQLDPDVAVAQLVGPVLFRYLFDSHDDIDGAFVVTVVDLFLRGASPPTDR